jgi:hypothetical protein
MIAVLLAIALCPLHTGYFKKQGPGFCFERLRSVGAYADYLRLHSFYKKWNEIISSHFGFGLHHCFGLSSIFGYPLPLYFSVLMDFGGDTSNNSQLKTQITYLGDVIL